MSNHDVSRYVTRWCENDPARARAALVLLLSLRGTAVLYYGDELAMPDTEMPPEELLDPVSRKFYPLLNRDAARTPMPWPAEAGAGFTGRVGHAVAAVRGPRRWRPWPARRRTGLRAAPHARAARACDASCPTTGTARTPRRSAPVGVWAWSRGEHVLVAVHLGDGNATLPDVVGTVRVGTDRRPGGRTGRRPSSTLGPWEAVVIERG